jgi:hypothetical protein
MNIYASILRKDKRVKYVNYGLSMIKWIDKLPLVPLAVIALLLAVLPFGSTPHLAEKVGMLFQGALTRPIDIFDLFMHGTPAVLLVIRIIRMGTKKSGAG